MWHVSNRPKSSENDLRQRAPQRSQMTPWPACMLSSARVAFHQERLPRWLRFCARRRADRWRLCKHHLNRFTDEVLQALQFKFKRGLPVKYLPSPQGQRLMNINTWRTRHQLPLVLEIPGRSRTTRDTSANWEWEKRGCCAQVGHKFKPWFLN